MNEWQMFVLIGTIYLAPNLSPRTRRWMTGFCFGWSFVAYFRA